MSCNLTPQSGPYLDRELPAAARAAFESHLPTCAECTQECARLSRLSRFLSAAATPALSPRVAFQTRLNRRRMEHFAEILMSAAALVIVVCGISLMKTDRPSANPAAAKSWERMAFNQQADPAPGSETDDPLVQVLLRELP